MLAGNILLKFNFSCSNSLNLVQSKHLSFGKELLTFELAEPQL